jgi:ATP-dependent helicase YprA (DUF1998 family)
VPEIPAQLAELASFGTPAARPDTRLYSHQDRALVDWFKSSRNLIVASGTGSGKTEIFLFVILAEILRDVLTGPWTKPRAAATPGRYNQLTEGWEHARLHETRRPTAAIILYPVNSW